jgi:hypothetical protein
MYQLNSLCVVVVSDVATDQFHGRPGGQRLVCDLSIKLSSGFMDFESNVFK